MDTNTDSPRLPGNIVFMEIPATMARHIGSFVVDPAIKVPVELGSDAANLASLTWEMIIAGMLRLLAYDTDNADAAYFRRFVLAVKPDIFDELSATGILKARNGELDVAEEIFKALGGLAPHAPEPILNLAILYEDKADALDRSGKETLADTIRGKAFDAYKRMLSMEPPYPDAFFNAGFFYMKNRSFDQAARNFEAYIGIGDDQAKIRKAKEIVGKLRFRGKADVLFKEAYDFIRMGKEEDGIARALEFVDVDPSVWNGWFLVGWGRRRLGRFDEGRDAFLKALELGADEVDVLNELAICEMELGMLSESRGRLEQALRKEPENIKIISNLGVVARKQGRDADASGFFRTVLELDPGDTLALAQLEELDD
jgi:tetratricopeptide (TPR) repeat protein